MTDMSMDEQIETLAKRAAAETWRVSGDNRVGEWNGDVWPGEQLVELVGNQPTDEQHVTYDRAFRAEYRRLSVEAGIGDRYECGSCGSQVTRGSGECDHTGRPH